MNLYLCSQNENTNYNTYDSFICIAKNPTEAMNQTPDESGEFGGVFATWCSSPEKVTVEYLGDAHKAMKAGVVLASFNLR